MRSIGEFFALLFLFFAVKARLFREERRVQREFYGHLGFKKCDQALLKAYRGLNPYRMTKEFLKLKGISNVHQYGETPLTVMAQIARECSLTPTDRLIELGCGRGRGVFFLSEMIGCSVHGIEWNPLFVSLAQSIPASKASFSCQDMCSADLSQASVIYLYGTCLDEESIQKLLSKLEGVAKETKIITISYPLSDYSPSFVVSKQFQVSFPWGNTEAYLNLPQGLRPVAD